MPAKSTAIYQLKIVLQSKPPIWRRIQVKSDITLDVLHQIIQTAMGWDDVHLHQFDVYGTFYSNPAFQIRMDWWRFRSRGVRSSRNQRRVGRSRLKSLIIM